MGDEETQEVADARETVAFVHAVALRVAVRCIEHVRAHEGLRGATMEERLDGAGYVWVVSASYRADHPLVKVEAEAQPADDAPPMVTPETFARILGNTEAGFRTVVPVPWVEAAARASDVMPA
jgi:hypothetical protein